MAEVCRNPGKQGGFRQSSKPGSELGVRQQLLHVRRWDPGRASCRQELCLVEMSSLTQCYHSAQCSLASPFPFEVVWDRLLLYCLEPLGSSPSALRDLGVTGIDDRCAAFVPARPDFRWIMCQDMLLFCRPDYGWKPQFGISSVTWRSLNLKLHFHLLAVWTLILLCVSHQHSLTDNVTGRRNFRYVSHLVKDFSVVQNSPLLVLTRFSDN